MTPNQWDSITFFDPNFDNFGDADKMNYKLLLTLDSFRAHVDKPIIIHCGCEKRGSGWHPTGRAIDCHVQGMSLLDQFFAAQRFLGFTGIGLYPWWHQPGLHLDNRPKGENQPRSIWGSIAPGKYVPVAKQFLFQTA